MIASWISTVLVCYTWTGLSMFYTVLMCYSYWICDQLLVHRSCLLHLDRSVNVLHCINVLQLLDMWGFLCKDIHRLVCYTWTGLSMLHCINVLQLLDMWSASCAKIYTQCVTLLDMWSISTALVCYTWTGLSMFYTVHVYWIIGFLYKDIHRSCLLHLDRSVNVLHCINVLQLLDMWSASCAKIYTALVCYTWTGLSMFNTGLMCYSYWICDRLLVQRYTAMSVTPGPVCQCSTLD